MGHGSFLGLGDEEKLYGTHNYKLEGHLNSTADVMVHSFEDSGHPVFRASSALDVGFLRKKGGAETSNAELSGRTKKSATPLQYVRSSRGLVCGSAVSWSVIFKH